MTKQTYDMKGLPPPRGYGDHLDWDFKWDLTARTTRAFHVISRSLLMSNRVTKPKPDLLGRPAPDPGNTNANGLRGLPKWTTVLVEVSGRARDRCLLPLKDWETQFKRLEDLCGVLDEAAVLAERAVLRLNALEAIEYMTAAEFLNMEVSAGTIAVDEVNPEQIESVVRDLARGVQCTRLNVTSAGKANYTFAAQYQRWQLAIALALIQHGESDSSFPR